MIEKFVNKRHLEGAATLQISLGTRNTQIHCTFVDALVTMIDFMLGMKKVED